MGTMGRSVALAMALENRAQGKRIADLRERRGLSQEELARRVGVSHGSVQNWEAGRGIRGENLRRVAEVLETTAEEIRGDAEMPNPFSLAAHLDERVEEFRRYSDEMRAGFARVEEKLDTLAAALLNGGAIPQDAWTRMREAAERFAAAHADDLPQAPRTAKTAKR